MWSWLQTLEDPRKRGSDNKEIVFSHISWSSTSVLHLCDSGALWCHQGLKFLLHSTLSPSVGWQLPLIVAKWLCPCHILTATSKARKESLHLVLLIFKNEKTFLPVIQKTPLCFLLARSVSHGHFFFSARGMELFWWPQTNQNSPTALELRWYPASPEDGHSIPELIVEGATY